MIPRIVHQMWISTGDGAPAPPPHLAEATLTWQDVGAEWEYRLWDDDSLSALFTGHRPDLLELYHWYPYAVQKSDAGRYLVLHVFGGIYADVDVARVGPPEAFDRVLDRNDIVLAPTDPLGVAADLVMAVPGHPIIRHALDTLPRSRRRWHQPWVPRHFRCMAGTGPLHLTGALRRVGGDVRLLTRPEYGHGSPDEALVAHLEGNTWAGWDTHVFLFISRHPVLLSALATALVAALLWALR